jgi:pyruvate formate lyase activating enzyme
MMVLTNDEKIGHKKGLIFDIQRFSLHDGPGIRTLIFLKGCQLRCRWCSNPEGQIGGMQLLFNKKKCNLCKECIKCCPKNANTLENKKIIHNKRLCVLCGKCVLSCSPGARSISGKWMTTAEIISILSDDEVFFRNSGGGVTLGGGEPTYQYDFVSDLLRQLKNVNINTAIETCGYIEWKKLDQLLENIDLVIFDLKHVDNEKHLKYTGVSNAAILDNLVRLIKIKKNMIVRITLIPGFNDSKTEKAQIIKFIRSIDKNIEIEYLYYHEYGKFKYDLIDRSYEFNKNGS